jgi:hypothetical protein
MCGTTLGLAARALENFPDFPVLSPFDVGAGLAGVEAVNYLFGTAGAVLMLLLVFLSVTSVSTLATVGTLAENAGNRL